MTQNRFYSSTAQKTALTGSITNAVTSIVVSATVGFPVSFPYTLILDRDTVSEEVVKVTAAAGTTLTVARGQDGTSAVAHSLGATVEHGVSAQDFSEPQAHMGTGSAVHGLTGSVVGTTDSQTLANKTLSSPVLNTPTVNNPAYSGTATGSLAGVVLSSPTLNTPTVTNPTLSGSGGTLTLPAGPDTLVGRATTDTLTNKTLTNPTVNGGAYTGVTLDATSTLGGVSGTTLAGIPLGRMASATNNTQSPFSNTETAILNMGDVSFTATSGRRYKVSVTLNDIESSASIRTVVFKVRDGGASAPTNTSTLRFQAGALQIGTTGGNGVAGPLTFLFELTGLTGVHRLGVFGLADAGSDSYVNFGGIAAVKSFIFIEDIGV